MTYKLKVLQQGLEQEEAAHKATKARLADKNKIYESIEGAKSEAMKGEGGRKGLSEFGAPEGAAWRGAGASGAGGGGFLGGFGRYGGSKY